MIKLHTILNKAFNQACHSCTDLLWLYVVHGTTYALLLFGLIYGSVKASIAMQVSPWVGLIGSAVLVTLLLSVAPLKKISKGIISFLLLIVESVAGLVVFIWILYGIYYVVLIPIGLLAALLSKSGIL